MRVRKLPAALTLAICLAAGLLCGGKMAGAQSLPGFDFAKARDAQGWNPTHDVGPLRSAPAGLLIAITGNDPYINGPARDYPAGQPLWLRVRLKSARPGMAQVFYYTAQKGSNEPDSVRFPVRGGGWYETRVPLPPLGPGTHFRFDPPGTSGIVLLAELSVSPRILLQEPDWPKPTLPDKSRGMAAFTSGDLQFLHAHQQFGGFEIRVAGEPVAVGFTQPLIGYLQNGKAKWLHLAEKGHLKREIHAGNAPAFHIQITARDEDGAEWDIRQRFAPEKKPNAIDVTTEVRVSQERSVIFLPMFVMLPGAGSFGAAKNQALFCGLEYLDKDEPSSSEADIIGPGAKRQVPDNAKITVPLMAIQRNDRYVGLIWEKDDAFSAVFDSPDRLFGSGGHVMGLIFPGSDGSNRVEGSLLPYDGALLKPGKPLTLRATLIGGRGPSVIPAVQQYVALRGLPPVPSTGYDLQGYIRLTAAGWLDSALKVGDRYRHAYPGPFEPHPAADSALFMDWLAIHTTDAALEARLAQASSGALSLVRPPDYNHSGVSHVRYPVLGLAYDAAEAGAAKALEAGRGPLGRFEPDGTIRYRPSPNGLDYGKTHFEPHANGLTAPVVTDILENATLTGDPALMEEGLAKLRALDRYANTVPRGAQTWEVPLHTPDILASAYLVRAYTLGYELTGDPHFKEQAQYWAWTGAPFLYLVKPVPERVGLYASIPVLGATQWVAPNWMGLPVQWCGLVYSDALYRFARHDPKGPWKQIADGITASGIQQTWPLGSDPERPGLLPDSYTLRAEVRNDAAINPGTLQANAVRFFGRPALYDFYSARAKGLLIHVPGSLADIEEAGNRVAFTVKTWLDRPYDIQIAGVRSTPRVRINGKVVPLEAPHRYLPEKGLLFLRLEGSPAVEVE